MGRLAILRVLTREQDEIEQLRHALSLAQDRAANLERALVHSRDIGAAIGILMATRRMSADEAFEMLRSTSQNCNRKVRDIALDVISQGHLPTQPVGMPHRQE